MPTIKTLPVKDIQLDLLSYRNVAQPDEVTAVQAMIASNPDYFWGLMDSLLADDGYLPTENILVLSLAKTPKKFIVREGNRRIAILKIIHGLIPTQSLHLPGIYQFRIDTMPETWCKNNATVPCLVYQESEEATLNHIIAAVHGKNDKASRQKWNVVTNARYNRNVHNANEFGLDILEKYVQVGKNLTREQASKWSSDYPLNVLNEAIRKIHERLGVSSGAELAARYPNTLYRDEFEAIIHAIGMQTIKLATIRAKDDFASNYGIPL